MMIELTPEQRRMVADHGETTHRVVDPDTHTTYVLIREEVFDRVKSLVSDDGDEDFPGEMYSHAMEVFGKAGWDDPALDVWNDLDPRGCHWRGL